MLAFAASGDAGLDARVAGDARRAGVPVNAVDRPELCDFFTPAIVNRAPVCVAIGTEGAGPVLAQMIRAKIDQLLSPSLGRAGRAGAARFRGAAERLVPKGSCADAASGAISSSGAPARAMEAGSRSEARARSRALAAAAAAAMATSRWSAPGRAPKTCSRCARSAC